MKKVTFVALIHMMVCLLLLTGCLLPTHRDESSYDTILPSRESKIPANASKISPENDLYPPVLHSTDYEDPIPLPSPINTAGGEDSAFIMPDGQTLYFFFTPDVQVPAEQQLFDGVTGIYVSQQVNNTWNTPTRVMLQDSDTLSLDGCAFVQNNVMWFCSAREGYTGIHWFTAKYRNERWTDWVNADFDPSYDVGELHFSLNETEVYFHSGRSGGKGGLDIWVLHYRDGVWQTPVNIESVNTAENEGWPFLSQDENELWFTRTYLGSPAIFRSIKRNETWQSPELILSQFAGESSLDTDGTIYFTHHFYENNEMIEADIYCAKKKA